MLLVSTKSLAGPLVPSKRPLCGGKALETGRGRMVMLKNFECESGDWCKGAKLAALCVGMSAYSEKSGLVKLGNRFRV